MDIPEYICNQVDLPICRAVNVDPTTYGAKVGSLFGIEFSAGYSLCLLLISIFMTVRMIQQINTLYSSIGRGEMKIILYLYIASTLMLCVILPFEMYFNSLIYSILAAIQLSFSTTMFFGIFISGVTIDRIYGIMRMTSDQFMASITLFYSVIMQVFIFLSIIIGNSYVILMTLIINTMSIFLYTFLQAKKLKKIKSDIWSYGVLGLIGLFYIFGLVHVFVGASLVAMLSNRNLDNMFFMLLYHFIMVMMIHKYWLGTCDFEVECLTLDV